MIELETFTIDSLVSIIATYRAFKINKDLAIKAMQELDRRRENGDVVPTEEISDLSSLLKSVGSGYVIKSASNDQIPDIIKELKELSVVGIKVADYTIFIGKIDETKFVNIKRIIGVLDIVSDKETIENASNSKIPPLW